MTKSKASSKKILNEVSRTEKYVANNFRKCRLQLNYSQKQLADELGISQSRISTVENGDIQHYQSFFSLISFYAKSFEIDDILEEYFEIKFLK